MNQTYKATLSQYALPKLLPTWGGKGGVIWVDLEGWSRDPMFEKYPSISTYTYCSNNPMKYVDPTGEELINSYQEGWDKAKQKLTEVKQAFDAFGGNRKADGYKEAKKNFNQAKKEFRKIDRPYQLVKEAMSDLAKYNPQLYVDLDDLEDAKGNTIDVYVYMDYLRSSGKEGVAFLNSDKNGFYMGDNKNPVYNILAIKLDYQCDLGLTLSHEGGHIKNFVQKFKDYLKWLTQNPYVFNNMSDHNGHDYNDPTGAEANHQEQVYSKNKYGR